MLRLKLFRLADNRTALNVARAAGLSAGKYSYIERGLLRPTPEERERLAAVLGVSSAALFRIAIRRRTSRQDAGPPRRVNLV